MVQWNGSFSCNVVSFRTLSRRFVGFSDECVFCLARIRSSTSLLVLSSPDLAWHGCWHRNFQLFPRVYNGFLELCICRVNEINTSQFSSIINLWFFRLSTLVFLCVELRPTYFPNFLPQVIWPGCCLFPCQPLPDHVTRLGGFPSNMVNRVKPVYATDRSRSPSILQQSSMWRPGITSKVVLAALATSIYRNGIGNDSSLGTQSVTLGSTWWR